MVTLESVCFGYRRDEPIIDGLSYDFGAGIMTAVTGASGRGKSTLLYLIGLLLTPWSGRIHIAGKDDVTSLGDGDRSRIRAEQMGFVFQDAVLDPSRTVLDNVIEQAIFAGMPRSIALPRARALLASFGVDLRADHKPAEVSGGQAQRVALCRALLCRPTVILADEPTGNLDPESAGVVIGALQTAARDDGATVVIASHEPRVVSACEAVLAL